MVNVKNSNAMWESKSIQEVLNMVEGSTTSQREVWDRKYSSHGSPWRGAYEGFEVPDLGFNYRILDLGCGTGKSMPSKGDVVGVDISKVALASYLVATHSSKAVLADAANLPFQDSSFDLALSYHIFDNLPDDIRKRAVAESLRVLAPGGTLQGIVFSVADLRFGKGKQVGERTFVRDGGIFYHYFEDGEISELLSGAEERRVEKQKRYGLRSIIEFSKII